jgi:murein L,D-transpeptidase YcbB/YkuD
MMSLFQVEYLPFLTRLTSSQLEAIVLYPLLCSLKNDSCIVQESIENLAQHLNIDSQRLSVSLSILKLLGLIELGEQIKILPIKPLTSEVKQHFLSKTGLLEEKVSKSVIQAKYANAEVPIDYQQLLNKKTLQKIYKELGTLKNSKEICNYLKLDHSSFKLFCEVTDEKLFKAKFQALAASIESPAEKDNKEVNELVNYLYDYLKDLGSPPASNWFPKNKKMAKTLLKDLTLEQAKQALDWGFTDPWWSTKITNVSHIQNLHLLVNRKSPKDQQQGIKRSTPLPDQVRKLLAEANVTIDVSTYEDAFFLKQSILEGQSHSEIKRVVRILEENGILPSGNDNLRFG